jgi:predicted TIM-barrel fold metal-dependent hydrolase
MIIDCHTHLGRNEHINASVDQLLNSMDEAKIDKALVFAGELNNAPNKWVLEQTASHRDRLLPVAAYIHSPQWKIEDMWLAEWYAEGKIAAVKFYVGYDHFYPTDISGILHELNKVGCPAIFHSGDCLNSVKCAKLKYAHPLNIDEVAVDYPKMNFIIAHMAFPWVRDAAEVCYKNDNVYADISGFVYGKFEGSDVTKFRKVIGEFLDIAGSDKLLFGTDWPISNQKSYVSVTNDLYGDAAYTSVQSLSQNVMKAFKL